MHVCMWLGTVSISFFLFGNTGYIYIRNSWPPCCKFCSTVRARVSWGGWTYHDWIYGVTRSAQERRHRLLVVGHAYTSSKFHKLEQLLSPFPNSLLQYLRADPQSPVDPRPFSPAPPVETCWGKAAVSVVYILGVVLASVSVAGVMLGGARWSSQARSGHWCRSFSSSFSSEGRGWSSATAPVIMFVCPVVEVAV
jgi:hypothetical protein